MKQLYIVDYWVPFPQSEYGGVVNVIADDDSEAFELLAKEEQLNTDYIHLIMPNVIKATRLNLSGEYQSGIIDAFIT
tara:strand:- start:1005 stop:1235 length:231 start_codon:yes stop_codon:yes gene_type:complete